MSNSVNTISGHIVILGWSPRIEKIVKELRSDIHAASADSRPILIVTEFEENSLTTDFDRVYFIYGRINDIETLRRANLEAAHALLIPSSFPETSVADGQSVFSLLAALSVNPKIRVCVEVSKAESGDTLAQIQKRSLTAGDIEVVSFESVAGRLLAQAAVNRGVTRVFDHLLSFSSDTNEIYTSGISKHWIGKTFRQVSTACFDSRVILIGFEVGGELAINPPDRERVFTGEERVWFISYDRVSGLKVLNPEVLQQAK